MIKAEQVGMSSKRLDRIGEVMRRLIGEKKIPGTVTLVARKGEVVHFEANGLRDVERNLPMEKDTIFRIYSQSKPITGAAIMMLFEEGKFLMTDPISKYLPEFAVMEVCVGEEKGNIQTGIPLANDLIKENEKILNESCINISKEKECIKINYYYQNPTKSKDDLITKNQISEDDFIETRGRKIDLNKNKQYIRHNSKQLNSYLKFIF